MKNIKISGITYFVTDIERSYVFKVANAPSAKYNEALSSPPNRIVLDTDTGCLCFQVPAKNEPVLSPMMSLLTTTSLPEAHEEMLASGLEVTVGETAPWGATLHAVGEDGQHMLVYQQG